MTKKLRRKLDFVFNPDGRTVNQRAVFNNNATLQIEAGAVGSFITLFTDHNYTKEALDELIAELLFLKEEWEQHPVYLEQEQAEDMEEIAEEEGMVGPEEQERIMQEEEDLIAEFEEPNPFENVANQREGQRQRLDFDEMVRQARRFNIA